MKLSLNLTLKMSILVATLCGFLISCSTFNSGDSPPTDTPSDVPVVDTSVGANQEAAPGMSPSQGAGNATETSAAVSQGQAAGDFPVDIGPAPGASGVEQVNVGETSTPPLKPVHAASSWTAKSASMESAPPPTYYGEKKPSKLSKKAKLAAAKKAKRGIAKAGKKSKSLAKKKPTKLECKKFAKNPKKHKKELAICKIEKKKTAMKAKRSSRG